MSLIDRMLSRTVPRSGETRRNVLVRVWLDDEGRVRDLKVRRSCGDPARCMRLPSSNFRVASSGQVAVPRNGGTISHTTGIEVPGPAPAEPWT